MEIEKERIILDVEKDYEFIRLIHHIIKIKYGSLEIKVKRSKPFRIIKKEKDIMLIKDGHEEKNT